MAQQKPNENPVTSKPVGLIEKPNKGALGAAIAIGLLLIIIVAAIGYISSTDNNQVDDMNAALDESQNVPNPLNDVSGLAANWRVYDTSYYSVSLADGWVFQIENSNMLYADCSVLDCYTVKDGTPAVISEVDSSASGSQGVFFYLHPADYNLEDAVAGYIESNTYENGYTLYTKEQTSDSQADALEEELPLGSTENILARKAEDGRTLYVYYTVLPEQRDPIETVLAMAGTIALKSE